MPEPAHSPSLAIIIPCADPSRHLGRVLHALRSEAVVRETIVVIDGTALPEKLAAAYPAVRFLCTGTRRGPAAARNLGAAQATDDLLLFLDDDTLPSPGLPARVVAEFLAHPEASAIYGSYDDNPEAPQLISQFKNLQHHFVHSTSPGPSATFWAGCGAIRRGVFAALGGFDTAITAASIEDIELGMRLVDHGHLVLLAPSLQVKHLKRWTLHALLITDHQHRALPWCRLLLQRRTLPHHLNLRWPHRIGVLTAELGLPCWLIAPLWPPLALAGLACWAISLGCQFPFLRFLARHRGATLAAAGAALILLYHLNAGLALMRATVAHLQQRLCSSFRPAPAVLPS